MLDGIGYAWVVSAVLALNILEFNPEYVTRVIIGELMAFGLLLR